jgi:hypothetical protein
VLFAAHAAMALGNAKQLDSTNDALQSRSVIGQAMDMLMHQYTLDPDGAFGLLVRTSSRTNVKSATSLSAWFPRPAPRRRRPARDPLAELDVSGHPRTR